MTGTRGWVFAMALLLCAPLAARGGFRCPAKGGAEWREYRSKHFLVQTDAARFKVELLVSRLESMHVLELQALLGEQAEIPGRLRVIAFANPALFTELAGKYQIAGYYKASALGEPTIVLPIEGIETDAQTVAHEVAHHLSKFLFVRQPAWFAEGLAEFVQTVADVGTNMEPAIGSHIVRGARDQRGGVGLVPRSMASALREARRVSFKELLEWDGRDDLLGASYHLYGWLLYHWLWNNRSKDLTAYQRRLSDGDDPEAAFRASFPDLDPKNAASAAKVDDALEQYRRSGRYMSYRVDAKADVGFEDKGPIASADAHMLAHDASRAWSEKERLARLVPPGLRARTRDEGPARGRVPEGGVAEPRECARAEQPGLGARREGSRGRGVAHREPRARPRARRPCHHGHARRGRRPDGEVRRGAGPRASRAEHGSPEQRVRRIAPETDRRMGVRLRSRGCPGKSERFAAALRERRGRARAGRRTTRSCLRECSSSTTRRTSAAPWPCAWRAWA